MAAGSKYGVYRVILCGRGLQSMAMVGRFKAGLPQSTIKVLLNQS